MRPNSLLPDENTITIFTDGSSKGNPGPGGFGVIAIYPDSKGVFKADELGGGEKETTNNRMEITACIKALESFDGYYPSFADKKFIVYTDSAYLINGATKWIFGWRQKGWRTTAKEDVKNRDLWERLSRLIADKKMDWRLLKGHSGVAGNERCDVIATGFADAASGGRAAMSVWEGELYRGSLSAYPLPDIFDIGNFKSGDPSSSDGSRSRSAAKAHSYVSMVDGKIKTHSSWAECEARVKGKSGARFKKAMTARDEETIKKEFDILEA